MSGAVPARRALGVAELTHVIRTTLGQQPALEDVLVEGELANLRRPGSGHLYFTLRDAGASLRCVCFRTQVMQLRFNPDDGMRVIAHGRVDVYLQDGTYQLYVDRIDPSGVGALALATEQLKRRLAAEGLFDERHKRQLPLLPRRVAVVTSPSGAAVRDVLTVLRRRAPSVGVVVVPALVQGDGAAQTIVGALERAQRLPEVDTILLVRGGGSLEDLHAFQDEHVARALRACRVAVVTGVGHETDTSIADLAADRRAPTPSAAAELAVPDVRRLRQRLSEHSLRLGQATRQGIARQRATFERATLRLERSTPTRRIPELRQRLDRTGELLRRALLTGTAEKRRGLDRASHRLASAAPGQRLRTQRQLLLARSAALDAAAREDMAGRRARVDRAAATLSALSPLRILDRGYALVLDPAGATVSSTRQLSPGARVRLRLRDGEADVEVTEVRPAGNR